MYLLQGTGSDAALLPHPRAQSVVETGCTKTTRTGALLRLRGAVSETRSVRRRRETYHIRVLARVLVSACRSTRKDAPNWATEKNI